MATTVIIPQADSATNQTILSTTNRTTSDTAGPWIVDWCSSAEIQLVCTSCSGTLNVWVQKLLPDNATYQDIIAFPQIAPGGGTSVALTTSGQSVASFVNAGNSIIRPDSAALTTSTALVCHFGNYWRVNYVLGAASNATFGVFGSFKR